MTAQRLHKRNLTMHTLQDLNALLKDAEPSLIERVYQQVQTFLAIAKEDPNAELHAILDECIKEADDPNTEWFSFEEVFDELRAELRAAWSQQTCSDELKTNWSLLFGNRWFSFAETMLDHIESRFDQLLNFPYSAPVYSHKPTLRRLAVADGLFIVFYRIQASSIQIVHIRRAEQRDWQ